MSPQVFTVVANIKANPSRMAKLNRMPSHMAKREQARKYAVADCQKIGFRAKEDDLVSIAVRLVG